MVRHRSRSLLFLFVVGVVVLLLMPALLAAQPLAPEPHTSALCQMQYVDRTVAGRPAWEVVGLAAGPDGGRLGGLYLKPGDVIVEVGGRPVEPGSHLDLRIRTALLEQRRTVTLVDPLTGDPIIYLF